jgi:diguanylate cyclase (GGDEF)-like protein
LAVAEALRKGIAAQKVAIGEQNLHLTLSIGVAAYGFGQTFDQCIKAADTALYQAELEGRDRVVAAPTPIDAD